MARWNKNTEPSTTQPGDEQSIATAVDEGVVETNIPEAVPVAPTPEPAPAPKAGNDVARLTKELREANAKLAAAESKLVQSGVSEDIDDLVRHKMRLGLGRDDAMVCARRQVLHDKALAEVELIKHEDKETEKGMREAFLTRALIVAASAS